MAVGSNLEGRPLTTHDKDGDEPGVLHVDKRVVFVGQVRNYCWLEKGTAADLLEKEPDYRTQYDRFLMENSGFNAKNNYKE